MNKKLFSKLAVLLVLFLSLVACGEKSNLAEEENSSKSSTSQSVSDAESSAKESVKTTSPSVENEVESEQEDVQENTKQDTQEDIQPDIQSDTQQEATEKEYYYLIKEAWQKQNDYIDSIDDPKVKQSVQTPESAAFF